MAAKPEPALTAKTTVPGTGDGVRTYRKVNPTPGSATNTAGQKIAGLLVRDSEIVQTRLAKGSTALWDETSQPILLHSLKRFLPKVTAASQSGTAVHVFQLFTVPKEQERCGSDWRLRWWDRVPDSELNDLMAACQELRTRQQTPGTPLNTVQVMNTLQFPNPLRDPDLYRLYGWPWNRKLAVLWGFEFPNPGLSPELAVEKLRNWSTRRGIIRVVWWGLLPLLAIALVSFLSFATYQWRTAADRQQRQAALLQIDTLIKDAEQARVDAGRTITRAREDYSDAQVIEVTDTAKTLTAKVEGLEKSLKGMPDFPEIADSLRKTRQYVAEAQADLSSAPKIVDEKMAKQASLLGQTLESATSTFKKALEAYAANDPIEIRDAKLARLNLKQAEEDVKQALVGTIPILGKKRLPSDAQQRLEAQRKAAEESRAQYRQKNPKWRPDL